MTASDVTAKERVSQRIKERLDELGMNARAFARKMGYKDGWINAIKDGRNALQLEDLDRAAFHLRTTAGDLIRRGDELYDLRPSEARLVRALRLLPPVIQDYLVTLTEYLVGVLPEEVGLLEEFRDLGDDQQAQIRRWVHVMHIAGPRGAHAPEAPNLDDLSSLVRGSGPTTHAPARGRKRPK